MQGITNTHVLVGRYPVDEAFVCVSRAQLTKNLTSRRTGHNIHCIPTIPVSWYMYVSSYPHFLFPSLLLQGVCKRPTVGSRYIPPFLNTVLSPDLLNKLMMAVAIGLCSKLWARLSIHCTWVLYSACQLLTHAPRHKLTAIKALAHEDCLRL